MSRPFRLMALLICAAAVLTLGGCLEKPEEQEEDAGKSVNDPGYVIYHAQVKILSQTDDGLLLAEVLDPGAWGSLEEGDQITISPDDWFSAYPGYDLYDISFLGMNIPLYILSAYRIDENGEIIDVIEPYKS